MHRAVRRWDAGVPRAPRVFAYNPGVAAVPPLAPLPASAALDAAQDALDHVRRHLFPFDFKRWLTLGFLAFLDQCGRGFGSQFPGGPGGTGGGDGNGGGPDVEAGLAWLAAHVVLVSVVAAIVLAFVVAVLAVLLWVNSRGVFMYLDNVATGRAEVARPWREHAHHASSYFAWSFGLNAATLTAVLLLMAGMAAAALLMMRGPAHTQALGVVVIVGLVLVLLAVAALSALVSVALRDFAAPLQMATGAACGDALRLFGALLRANKGLFALYLLLKVCFTMVLAVVVLVVGCCTCCCGFVPVITQTILQPGFYFERAWSLHLLRRLGYVLPPPTGTGDSFNPAGPDVLPPPDALTV